MNKYATGKKIFLTDNEYWEVLNAAERQAIYQIRKAWDDGNDPLVTTDKRGVANISELSASVNRLHEKIDNLPANDAEGTRDTASVTGGSNRDNSALVRQPPNKKMKT